MAFESDADLVGVTAATDLSTYQYRLVKMTSSGINLCGDGEAGIGVLQNKPTSGQACWVKTRGVSKVYCGATLTVGANVSSGASGVCNDAASTDYELGVCLVSAGNTEYGTILLFQRGVKS